MVSECVCECGEREPPDFGVIGKMTAVRVRNNREVNCVIGQVSGHDLKA